MDMFYSTQEIWTWWIAIYLFLGGLGGGIVTVSILTDLYYKPHKKLVLWGNISAFIMLSIGSLLLFLHLLHYVAVINVLNPMVLFLKPDAWISWGTQFIVWMMVWSMVYTLPYILESPFWMKIPVVGSILRLFGWLGRMSMKFHAIVGGLAVINSVGTVFYTGLLLQSFPAVALWHNPGVPILFIVSAFSTTILSLIHI